MSTVSARTQFVLSARDQTGAGIGTAKRALMGLEAAGMRVRTAFAGMFAGFLGGSLIKNVVRSFIEINKNVDPVKNSFTTLDRAWQKFALNVGKGGLNSALIEFNENMVRVTGSFDGLASTIGAFLGSAVNEVSRIFEGIGRAIAFAGDNLAILKGLVDSFTGNSGPKKVIDVDAAAIEWLKSMGFETKALDGALKSLKETGSGLPPTFKELADSAKDAKDPMKELRETAQKMWLDTQTPLEKYNAGLRELNVLQANGVLIQDTYARRQAQLKQEFLGTAKTVKEEFITLKEVGSAFGNSFSSALQGLTDGTFNLKNALGSLLSDLTSLFSNQALSLLGGQGGGGFLSNLFGSFGGLYAKGGTLGAGKWGVAGENGPEIVEGPATITPMRAGGDMKVVVNNYAGADVKTSRDSSGSLIVTVRQMVNDTIGGGYADKALRGRHGLTPQMARR